MKKFLKALLIGLSVLFILFFIFLILCKPNDSAHPAYVRAGKNTLPYTHFSDQIVIGESTPIDYNGIEANVCCDNIFYSVGYNKEAGYLFIINVSDKFPGISFLKDYPFMIKLNDGETLKLRPNERIGVYGGTMSYKYLGLMNVEVSTAKAYYTVTEGDLEAIRNGNIIKHRCVVGDTPIEITYPAGDGTTLNMFTEKLRKSFDEAVRDYDEKIASQEEIDNYENWKEEVISNPEKGF